MNLDPHTRLKVVAGAIVVSVVLRSALTFASDAIYARAGHELRTDLQDHLAVTTSGGSNRRGTDPLRLPRRTIVDTAPDAFAAYARSMG